MEGSLHKNQILFLETLDKSMDDLVRNHNISLNRVDLYPLSKNGGMAHCTPSTFIDFIDTMLKLKQNTKAPTIKLLLNRILKHGGYDIVERGNVIKTVRINTTEFTYTIE